MAWLRVLLSRFTGLFDKARLEQELDEEVRAHLDLLTEENRRKGMEPEEARLAARRQFGNISRMKEECRDRWSVRFIDELGQNVRYGLRQLRRNPGFTIVAVLTLAVGIGANTAIFMVASDFLLRPLPFSNSNRVVRVKWDNQRLAGSGWFDPPTFKYFQERNRVFQQMAAWGQSSGRANLTGKGVPERVRSMQVSAGFFRVLGVTPILGRTFLPAEERPGGNRVALISHALWQSRFGASSSVIGRTIILDGNDYAVIGVLPAGFRFSTPPEDVWTPLAISFNEGYGSYFLNVIACLKPGLSLAQARSKMTGIFGQFARQFPQWAQGKDVLVSSLRNRYDRNLRPALLALMLAAGLVLLMACINLANLLIARAETRFKEIAIRRTLGANRTRIIRQMLTESSLLALLAGGGGLLIAIWGARLLYAVLPAGWQPLTRGGIDLPVVLFALAVSLLSMFLFGLAPAWRATDFDLSYGLKEGSRVPLTRAGRWSLRTALVAGEMSLAVILLTGAVLLMRSFERLAAVNMGFRPENVLTVSIARTGNDPHAFYMRVLERISALPRVRAAGAVNFIPLSGGRWSQDITIEDRPPRPRGDSIWAAHRDVTLGYFGAMGIPLLKGRLFAATDQNKRVVVISKTMARRYWPGENPIGKRFGVNCSESKCNWNTVIGVVGDVKELGAAVAPDTAMYFLGTDRNMTLVVRSTLSPISLVGDIRGIIYSTDPDQPLGGIRSMSSVVSNFIAPQRLTALISGFFSSLALLLACVGIYGVISYFVSQRTHEIGIRMALGAQKNDVLKMVVGQGFKLALIGVAVGIGGALALTRFLSSLLYGVKPTDPLTFIAVSLILIAVGLLACYIPARRAAKIDPMVALRYE